jgi:hypothetical protein
MTWTTCIFVTVVIILPSQYLATKGGFFLEALPSNDKGIHRDKHTNGRDFLSKPLKKAQVL